MGWLNFVGRRRAIKRRHKGPLGLNTNAVFPDCPCRKCKAYYARKDAKVTAVGAGGAGGSSGNSGFWRCQACKRRISGGTCHTCGAFAGMEYVATVGGGGSGGSGGSTATGGGGGGSSSSNYASGGTVNPGLAGNTCLVCSAPIPSGLVCGLTCLKVYNPAAGFFPGGCLDCGAAFAPTYHPGCAQAGRVTGYLPIPGPYGSNGLTRAQASAPAPTSPAQPKRPIPVSGMRGYSESGTPDDWDMEIGVIRGYRWFRTEIPESWAGVRKRSVRPGYYDATGKPDIQDEGPLELEDRAIQPLIGAYGGAWQDGVNEATCTKSHTSAFQHLPPETRVACGCGFWAYFDPDLKVETVLGSWSDAQHSDWTGIAVLGCIEGTGRVIIGEKGFRAQYAKITAMAIGQVAVPNLMWWRTSSEPTYAIGTNRRTAAEKVQCSDDELFVRLARIEDMLSRKYPSARVVTSENTLRKLYPPDMNGSS